MRHACMHKRPDSASASASAAMVLVTRLARERAFPGSILLRRQRPHRRELIRSGELPDHVFEEAPFVEFYRRLDSRADRQALCGASKSIRAVLLHETSTHVTLHLTRSRVKRMDELLNWPVGARSLRGLVINISYADDELWRQPIAMLASPEPELRKLLQTVEAVSLFEMSNDAMPDLFREQLCAFLHGLPQLRRLSIPHGLLPSLHPSRTFDVIHTLHVRVKRVEEMQLIATMKDLRDLSVMYDTMASLACLSTLTSLTSLAVEAYGKCEGHTSQAQPPCGPVWPSLMRLQMVGGVELPCFLHVAHMRSLEEVVFLIMFEDDMSDICHTRAMAEAMAACPCPHKRIVSRLSLNDVIRCGKYNTGWFSAFFRDLAPIAHCISQEITEVASHAERIAQLDATVAHMPELPSLLMCSYPHDNLTVQLPALSARLPKLPRLRYLKIDVQGTWMENFHDAGSLVEYEVADGDDPSSSKSSKSSETSETSSDTSSETSSETSETSKYYYESDSSDGSLYYYKAVDDGAHAAFTAEVKMLVDAVARFCDDAEAQGRTLDIMLGVDVIKFSNTRLYRELRRLVDQRRIKSPASSIKLTSDSEGVLNEMFMDYTTSWQHGW